MTVKNREPRTRNGGILTALGILLAAGAGGAKDADPPLRSMDPAAMGLLLTIAPGGDPFGIAFTRDGRRLAVGVEHAVVVYETERWREVARLTGHPQFILGLAWSPDGKTIAAGGFQGAVVTWDVATGATRTFSGHSTYVGALAFSADSTSLVTGSNDGSVRVWNLESGSEAKSATLPGAVLSAALSRDGRRMAFGLGSGEVEIWRLAGGVWESERRIGLAGGGNVFSVRFTRDGTRVAAATESGLTLSGVATGQEVRRFEIPTQAQGCLQLTPDDRYAIVYGNDMAVKIHDLTREGQEVAKLLHHTGPPSGVAVRPDGRFLATIGHDHHLKIWGRVPPGMPRLRPKGFCGIRLEQNAQGRVVVTDVIAGTAAQRAGIQVGDLLRSVSGAEIRNPTDSIDRIGAYFEGDEVEFVVERGGEPRSLKIKLGQRPSGLEN